MYRGNNLTLERDGRWAHLLFDGPGSVNTFSRDVVQEFGEALDRVAADTDVEGLLISSAKSSFIVGADIHEFAGIFAAGESAIRDYLSVNVEQFLRLEALTIPTVVAIEGMALGGGMELALACDYRVVSENARLGLPETKLGIIPGWGGTTRLPRLAGLETAIEWIAGGAEQPAAKALRGGVVDAIVAPDQLLAAARHTLAECARGALDVQRRRRQKQGPLPINKTEAGLAFHASRAVVGARAGRHYPAPVAAIDAMEKAAPMALREALAVELDAFVQVALTPQARALSGIFVADQLLGKKAKQWARASDRPVARAAVLGAGIMGGGIACQSAYKGVPVTLKDIEQKGIDLGLSEARNRLQKRVDRGRLSVAAMSEALTRIDPTLHFDDVAGADILVEAVVENEAVKRSVLAEAERAAPEAVLCSNTSTISITRLAQSLERPERFCGMHFFNPVHAMPLVEVIRGEKTGDEAVARTVAYASALGKKPVVVGDCPGFLVNRVLFPYFSGFALLLRDGVDFERIDRVMERWGWPMGPAWLLDVVGLDTAVHAEQVMADGYPDRLHRDFTSAHEALFKAGALGQKSGSGFYHYRQDKRGKPVREANEQAKALVGSPSDMDDETIVMRMMIPMVTELVRCLEDGVVETPAEADMAMIYGTGFPPFRGGVLRWVDTLGLERLTEAAASFEELGPLYEPPAQWRDRLAHNQPFYPEGA